MTAVETAETSGQECKEERQNATRTQSVINIGHLVAPWLIRREFSRRSEAMLAPSSKPPPNLMALT